MKYKDIINFTPIEGVLSMDTVLSSAEERRKAVEDYVFSSNILEDLTEDVIPNLDTEERKEGRYTVDKKGVAVTGSYGTGKTHLLSFLTTIAEDAAYLEFVTDEKVKEALKAIAGGFKVCHFTIGTNIMPLSEITLGRLEEFCLANGVEFKFNRKDTHSYSEQIASFMASFQEKFPNKSFLLIMDELLERLETQVGDSLNSDLMFLREMGEAVKRSRFRIIYSAQKALYNAPSLANNADMLNKIQDRYIDIVIAAQDIAFVVQKRLLKKTEEQTERIREHLEKFKDFYPNLKNYFEKFVEFYPVHPSYIEAFRGVQDKNSKRRILETLSKHFRSLMECEIKEEETGFITYDSYYPMLLKEASSNSIINFRSVQEVVEIVEERIEEYYKEPAVANRKPLAKRVLYALTILALKNTIRTNEVGEIKINGKTAAGLIADLFPVIKGVNDAATLTITMENTCADLVKYTQGQYIAYDRESNSYYLRVSGGVNVEGAIRNRAQYYAGGGGEPGSPDDMNAFFFSVLKELLQLNADCYDCFENVWEVQIDWPDKHSARIGYIFFGLPNDRSTTIPDEQFYIYIKPLYKRRRGAGNVSEEKGEDDEVFISFQEFSPSFIYTLASYAAATYLCKEGFGGAGAAFNEKAREYKTLLKREFREEFLKNSKVIYKEAVSSINSFNVRMEGEAPIDIIYKIASLLLNQHFCDNFPSYPAFNFASTYLTFTTNKTRGNITEHIKRAIKRMLDVKAPGEEGKGVLRGLGLLEGDKIDVENSIYAKYIMSLFLGDKKVVNRDEILTQYYEGFNLFYLTKYNLEHPLVFLLLLALVFKDKISIYYNGNKRITTANFQKDVEGLREEDFYSFRNIALADGFPYKKVEKLCECLALPSYRISSMKDIEARNVLENIKERERKYLIEVEESIRTLTKEGITCAGVSFIKDSDALLARLKGLQTMLNNLTNFDTVQKLSGLYYGESEMEKTFSVYKEGQRIKEAYEQCNRISRLYQYLTMAKGYVREKDKEREEIEKILKGLEGAAESKEKGEEYIDALNKMVKIFTLYYMGEYNKYHIEREENEKKKALLDGVSCRTLLKFRGIKMLELSKFNKTLEEIERQELKDYSISVSTVKEKIPSFNPNNYTGTPKRMERLAEEMEAIYIEVNKRLKDFLTKEETKDKSTLLKEEERKAIEGYLTKGVEYSKIDKFVDAVNKVVSRIAKVEITVAEVMDALTMPLGLEEACGKFRRLLQERSKEYNSKDVVILFRK